MASMHTKSQKRATVQPTPRKIPHILLPWTHLMRLQTNALFLTPETMRLQQRQRQRDTATTTACGAWADSSIQTNCTPHAHTGGTVPAHRRPRHATVPHRHLPTDTTQCGAHRTNFLDGACARGCVADEWQTLQQSPTLQKTVR